MARPAARPSAGALSNQPNRLPPVASRPIRQNSRLQAPTHSNLAGETVARATHGLNQVLMRFAQGLAQAADMHVNGAFLDIDIAAPYLVEQLATGIGALLVGHEELQQTILGGAYVERAIVRADTVADRIKYQPIYLDGFFDALRGGAAQYGLESCDQLPGREGFGDVVIGTSLQTLDLVVLFASGGEHDDR